MLGDNPHWLREQYRQDKALLTPHLDRIKDLGRQVAEAVATARESLAARYLEAVSAANAWERTREACRDALMELAAAEQAERLEAAGGWVEVKRIRTLSLPEAGTPQREELCATITRAGRWPEVASPNAARLLKAVDGGLFSPQETGEIARLCPTQTVCRLVGHVAGQQ